MTNSIEASITRYNKIKVELLKVSQCLEQCEEADKEFYQKITEDYADLLKKVQLSMKENYGIKLCSCCEVFCEE